jgi:hypothetical protein
MALGLEYWKKSNANSSCYAVDTGRSENQSRVIGIFITIDVSCPTHSLHGAVYVVV